jgi:peptide/nickel transport system substrate-binding protein
VTADDVAYTWVSHVKYGTDVGNNYGWLIDSIDAIDTYTVLVKAKVDEFGKASILS